MAVARRMGFEAAALVVVGKWRNADGFLAARRSENTDRGRSVWACM